MKVQLNSRKRENVEINASSVAELKQFLKEVKPLKDCDIVIDDYVFIAKIINQYLKLFDADEINDMKMSIIDGSLNIKYRNGQANFYQAHMCTAR